jgi:hypothetical protein
VKIVLAASAFDIDPTENETAPPTSVSAALTPATRITISWEIIIKPAPGAATNVTGVVSNARI